MIKVICFGELLILLNIHTNTFAWNLHTVNSKMFQCVTTIRYEFLSPYPAWSVSSKQ